MNRLEKKVENGTVKVRVVGAPGNWSDPVILNGQFYRSAKIAAETLCCSVTTIHNALDASTTVKGQPIRYATEQEVDQFISAPLPLIVKKLDTGSSVIKKKYEGKVNKDGSFTLVRHFSSISEVPPEMRNDIEITWE